MNDDELTALTRRYLDLAARRDDLDLELGAIKAKIRDNITPGDTLTTTDGIKVTVTANRRFNPAKAAEIIPADLLTLCQTTVVDAKKAKSVLPPALYEAAMVTVGDPVVRIT